MGGCRCTYRNCTVKSDGKTHMFHYPVFEKIRCHQWLLNAHRLEFLNLKVSQLKNRVVCQHHFRDENFMNFKKDKLTFDAIPTEDGPYCDTTNYVDVNPDSSKLFSIIIEDIENDYNDKKANYSIKYGDFLANLDLMDIEKIDDDSISYKNTCSKNRVLNNNSLDVLSPHKGKDKNRLFNEDQSYLFNISLPDKSDKKNLTHPTLAVSPYMSGTDYIINNPQNYQLQSTPKGKNISVDTKNHFVVSNEARNVKSNHQKQEVDRKEPKIKILSEKKVTDPVPITGKFEHVSPNFVLNVSKKRRVTTESLNNYTSNCLDNKDICVQDNKLIEIEVEPLIKFEECPKPSQFTASVNLLQNTLESEKPSKILNTQQYVPSVNLVQNTFEPEQTPKMSKPQQYISSVSLLQNTFEPEKSPKIKAQQHIPPVNLVQNTIESVKSPKVSIIKSKVPPERVEAINKKREFNMKLRDIVESCLDKLDNCEKANEQSKPVESTKPKLNRNKVHHVTSLPKNTTILSPQEYTISFLEARMRKMENALLEKIDQNSTKINDLKNIFLNTSSGKQTIAQTRADEETHKKQLFQEIAKYLSPTSKSLIYEELFINKFALHESTTPAKPKRRRRK